VAWFCHDFFRIRIGFEAKPSLQYSLDVCLQCCQKSDSVGVFIVCLCVVRRSSVQFYFVPCCSALSWDVVFDVDPVVKQTFSATGFVVGGGSIETLDWGWDCATVNLSWFYCVR
jgi:hypothetical protein